MKMFYASHLMKAWQVQVACKLYMEQQKKKMAAEAATATSTTA